MMPNEGYFSSLKTIGRYFSSLKSLFLSIQKNIKRLLELLLRILNERLVYLIIGQIQMLKNTYAPHPYEHTYVHPISI